MKKELKRGLIIAILIIIVSSAITLQKCYAGFADYDDKTAEEETKNLIQEQENKQKDEIGKSNDNYLSRLSVEGYKLSPEFDKQTLDYKIEESIDTEKIKIDAIQDDSRATISGIGEITLKNGENKIRIDVTAENGTVRTYFITVNANIKEEGKTSQPVNEETNKIENTENIENTTQIENNNVVNTSVQNKSSIIPAIIIVVILVGLILIKKANKK